MSTGQFRLAHRLLSVPLLACPPVCTPAYHNHAYLFALSFLSVARNVAGLPAWIKLNGPLMIVATIIVRVLRRIIPLSLSFPRRLFNSIATKVVRDLRRFPRVPVKIRGPARVVTRCAARVAFKECHCSNYFRQSFLTHF